jgi:hypothetical protein
MGKKYTKSIIALAATLFVGGAAAEERHGGHMHHHFPKDVDAFHAVLAPLWHARPGPERAHAACAKADEMERLAKDIRSGDAAPLAASVANLKKTCPGRQGEVDAALFDVHEAFHRLAEPGHAR